MSEQKHRVTFHIEGWTDEKTFDTVYEAEHYILEVMHGNVIYETTVEGEPAFIPLHRISGAIIHPRPVADV